MQVPPSLFRMMLLLVLKIWATIPDVSYFSVCLKLSSVLFFDLFSLTAETKVPSNSRCISITLSLSTFFLTTIFYCYYIPVFEYKYSSSFLLLLYISPPSWNVYFIPVFIRPSCRIIFEPFLLSLTVSTLLKVNLPMAPRKCALSLQSMYMGPPKRRADQKERVGCQPLSWFLVRW